MYNLCIFYVYALYIRCIFYVLPCEKLPQSPRKTTVLQFGLKSYPFILYHWEKFLIVPDSFWKGTNPLNHPHAFLTTSDELPIYT